MSTPNRSADQGQTDKSLGELIASLHSDVSALVTDQIALAKAEFRDSARDAAAAGALIGAAAFIGVLTIIFLFVTLAYVLVQLGLSVWAGFGIVTLLLLVLTMVFLLIARSRGNKVKAPQRTARSIAALSDLRPGTPADNAPAVDVSA